MSDDEIPAAPPPDGDVPLFDARYRWVLLFALRWLREVPEVDLDEPEQLDAAYHFASTFVQAYLRERRLGAKLDPMRVSAVAGSRVARAVVLDLLLDWRRCRDETPSCWDFLASEGAKARIQKALRSRDPSLEPAEIERLAREKRKGFAQSFGVQARVTEAHVSSSGDVRVSVAFEQDIALGAGDLADLAINGVPLPGARLDDVRRVADGSVKVEARITASAPAADLAALRSLPMTVEATTADGVRLEAFKASAAALERPAAAGGSS
jgi:hypothetical protein